jgi:hypothetical protein
MYNCPLFLHRIISSLLYMHSYGFIMMTNGHILERSLTVEFWLLRMSFRMFTTSWAHPQLSVTPLPPWP